MRMLNGFKDFKIEYFIKIGGSLSTEKRTIENIVKVIKEFSQGKRIVLFPGGGSFDNLVEDFNEKYLLNTEYIDIACALAQDQTGLLISNFDLDLIKPVKDFKELSKALAKGKIPLLLPSYLIQALNVFEETFEITSDSIGAYFAYLLNAKNYVIMTDVDGIFDGNPKINKQANFISEIDLYTLKQMGHTSVDIILPQILEKIKIPTYVMNGLYPERIIKIKNDDKDKYTKIMIK